MELKTEWPRKAVVDYTFVFLNGTTFLITLESGEFVDEEPDRYVVQVTRVDGDNTSVQIVVLFKHNLTSYTRIARTVVDYPKGQSPAELAIAEIDERNARRIAARSNLPAPEGA